jgi:hypothetical protein
MLRKYVSFAVFCLITLLAGIVLSLPFSIRVTSTGEKPPFVLALLLLITTFFSFIMPLYLSSQAWVEEAETRKKLGTRAEQLAKRYGPFRLLVVTNATFLLWNARIVYLVVALFSLGLFILIILSAF